MLHTKFQGHRSFVSEEDFPRFLPHMHGCGSQDRHVTQYFEQFFVPASLKAVYEIWLQLAYIVVSEEKSFEIVDGPQRDNRACLSYKLTRAFGSCELKMLI